jgi:hypothetical protein
MPAVLSNGVVRRSSKRAIPAMEGSTSWTDRVGAELKQSVIMCSAEDWESMLNSDVTLKAWRTVLFGVLVVALSPPGYASLVSL